MTKEIIENYINKAGLKMSKKLSSGSLFTEPVYDIRICHSLAESSKLSKEGFVVDESLGIWLFNALVE